MGKKLEKLPKENIPASNKILSSRTGTASSRNDVRPQGCAELSPRSDAAHYTRRLGGSDPLQYIWAARQPKIGGRSRLNRGFRSRSFFSIEFRNSFLSDAFPRGVREWNAEL
jgi:hypothetical protein